MAGRLKAKERHTPQGNTVFFLAVCGACLLAAARPAFAQPQLTISSAEVEPGAEAALTLTIEGLTEEVAGIHVEFTVPANVMFDGAVAGGGLAGFSSESYTFAQDGAMRAGFIAYSTNRTIDPALPLASVNFMIDAAAPDADAVVAFTGSWLSNVTGTATLVHSSGSGVITIGAGGGGEPLDEIAQDLFDGFAAGDTDNDDRLSLSEATGIRPSLTDAQFEAIDANGDSFITMEELIAAGAMAPPVGPSCCDPGKRFTFKDLEHYLGDVLLLGLALLTLSGLCARTSRP